MHGPPPFLQVLPTRVRRNYTGGALLERWTAAGDGRDGDQPEDWIASTVEAKNPGLPAEIAEGVTRVRLPDGRVSDLAGSPVGIGKSRKPNTVSERLRVGGLGAGARSEC